MGESIERWGKFSGRCPLCSAAAANRANLKRPSDFPSSRTLHHTPTTSARTTRSPRPNGPWPPVSISFHVSSINLAISTHVSGVRRALTSTVKGTAIGIYSIIVWYQDDPGGPYRLYPIFTASQGLLVHVTCFRLWSGGRLGGSSPSHHEAIFYGRTFDECILLGKAHRLSGGTGRVAVLYCR